MSTTLPEVVVVSAEDKDDTVNESNAGLLALLLALALAMCCLFICVIVGTIAASAMYVQNKKQRQAEHEFANVSLEDLLMQGSKGRMLYEAAHGVDRGPPVGQLWSPGGELDLAARGDEALGRSLVTGDGFDDDFEGFVGRGANPLFDDALGASRSDLNASAHNPLRETRLGHMALDGDVRGVNPLQGGAGGDKWIDDSGTFVGGSRHQGGGVDLEEGHVLAAGDVDEHSLGGLDAGGGQQRVGERHLR